MVVHVEIVGRILRLPVQAHLEVQMGCCSTACLAYEGYHLPGLDAVAYLHQVLRVVAVVGFQPVSMLDAYQVTIPVVLVREHHLAIKGSIDIVLVLCLEIDTCMLFATTMAEGADEFSPRQRKAPVAGVGLLVGGI